MVAPLCVANWGEQMASGASSSARAQARCDTSVWCFVREHLIYAPDAGRQPGHEAGFLCFLKTRMEGAQFNGNTVNQVTGPCNIYLLSY